MESTKVSKHFTCRTHAGEPIQRISKELFGENSLFCIECLIEADKTGDANLVTVPKFIEFVSNHFAGFSKLAESKAKAPSKLVSFLADEETALLKLQSHIESEKVKVDVAVSSIQQTFNQLCNKKKSELYKIFDDQYLHLKSNFANYRSKLNKYFPSDNSQQEKFDVPTLISTINACQATEDLEMYIKHLKDEMLDTKVIPADPKEQEKELSINLGQFAEALQDQMNNLPTLKVSSELETTTKDLEKLVKPFFEDFGKIDNLIYELSIGKLVLMESKILKDPRDVEMLRKWISPKGKCQFKLLFQGSRDGFSASKFHQLCDNYTDTIILVKSKTYNKIFGGYADVTWNATSNYKNSSKTFLFSITEKQKFKIKAGSETYGTYANSGYLAAFGGGHDFMITDNCNTSNSNYSNFGHSYDTGTGSNDNSKLAGAYNFQVEEFECYHLDYDNAAPEETDLMKDSEMKQLKEWIAKGKKVELQRIYQGTKDGFDAVNFHEKCDGKGPTLTVVKSQGFGKLFGGYTTIPWAQTGNFASDKKAFLFSLTKGKKYSVMNGDCAVMHGAESGPVFGAGYDMFICSNANILAESTTALGLTYACDDPEPTLALAGTPEFMIDEIETFLVKIK